MKGAIAWMAQNSVAANLLMIFFILIGIVGVSRIVQEVFPESSLDTIQIRVAYPGASPEEVEEGIIRRIEEQIESVDGIKRITSISAENVGIVNAQLKFGTDASRVLDDLKAEIDRIVSFPVEAEEPEVSELTTRRQVIQLAVYGDVPERSLKELANAIKDDLSALDGISYVRINGTRAYEISIEVSEATMRAFGLSLAEVSLAVRRGSLDLPGGSINTRDEVILIRTKGQNYSADDFRDIIVRAMPNGAVVRIRDIATVRDAFEEADLITRFDGQPAALVEVYRTGDERVLESVALVKEYVAAMALPEGISVAVWQDEAKLLKDRFELMLKNGLMGLLLVILALGLFMNSRLAFWVSMGIFISFLGTFAIMVLLGVSMNLISLVAFILALGIVVDDAIVIGENIFVEQERGLPPKEASVKGTVRLVRPVVFAVLTTIAAFTPLLFVPGVMGKFMQNLPVVIISVLVLSLVESLFILPAHLSHVKALIDGKKKNPIAAGMETVQKKVAKAIQWNIEGPLDRMLHFATQHFGIVIASAVSAILLSVGLIAGGFVNFTFYPEIAGENVIARIEMPDGTPAERTAEIASYVEEKGWESFAELQADLPEDHEPLIRHALLVVGRQPSISASPVAGGGPGLIEGRLAEINFELLESENRDIPTVVFEEAWRNNVGSIAGVKSIQFQSILMQFGKPIQIEVSVPDPVVLSRAIARLKDELGRYAGVYDVEDDQQLGKREIKLELKPQARSLGVSLDDLARQVRSAYYGNEALRIQRGRDEIKVMVRLPENERDALSDLDDLRIRTAQGVAIPFSEVADASFGYGPSSIYRRDRRRVVTITAEVNDEIVAASDVIESLRTTVLPQIAQDFPGFQASFEGEKADQEEAIGALLRGFIIALFMIYALLAIPFRSYSQPFIIMAVIPFGLIGALLGHMFMGLDVGILSLFGLIGLSGVVVNDSLVLIDYVNTERENGATVENAVITAGKVRFRPIMLTSLTTFLGVLPLMLEKSLQAQFLIPIAASLGYGILFATFIILILVPALVVAEDRIRITLRSAFSSQRNVPEMALGTTWSYDDH